MNILITGASKGIGKCIAENLDGEIFAVARTEECLKQYKNYLVCDLSGNLDKLGEFIQDNNIDIVINNAGNYIYKSSDEIIYSEIEYITRVNLMTPMYVISKALPYMKKQKWGRIINIGSISGVMGEAYAGAYSATKAGLIGLTKSVALEVAEYNITVNTINPGWVETELGQQSINDSEFSEDEVMNIIPQKRYIEPIEITNLIKYLISDEAKGITGQSINLCAGLSVGY